MTLTFLYFDFFYFVIDTLELIIICLRQKGTINWNSL